MGNNGEKTTIPTQAARQAQDYLKSIAMQAEEMFATFTVEDWERVMPILRTIDDRFPSDRETLADGGYDELR
jgi:hypothetical protein